MSSYWLAQAITELVDSYDATKLEKKLQSIDIRQEADRDALILPAPSTGARQ